MFLSLNLVIAKTEINRNPEQNQIGAFAVTRYRVPVGVPVPVEEVERPFCITKPVIAVSEADKQP